jgi:hypothetical protein
MADTALVSVNHSRLRLDYVLDESISYQCGGTTMNRKQYLSALALGLTLAIPATSVGEEGKAQIISPLDGAILDAMNQNQVAYEVSWGPRGDHSHLYVDNKEVAILRKLKGSYPLDTLSPGKHSLCLKVVNKGHVPIGIDHCIKVTVE